MKKSSALAVVCAAAIAAAGAAGSARADTIGPTTFEGFALDSVNGQEGWSSTGPFDQAVVSSSRFTGFGDQSLRISNAVTSGSFGDQTFSPALAQPASESGPRYFEASLDIGTTQDTEQSGLSLSVSPDNGTGARMSYVRFADQSDGVHVYFDDVTDAGPVGAAATFNEKDIATLARTSAHTVRFTVDLVPGPANDVVHVFVDGALRATGTTWEDYYRYDPEQAGGGNTVPAISKLLFRAAGPAATATAGGGFLFDNVSLTSSSTVPCEFSAVGTTWTLVESCATDHSIIVPDGFTLDGDGHTITAVDPAGGHFVGAVVTNAGTSASIRNLEVTASGLANVCDSGADRLRGILLNGASGAISNVDVHGVRQGPSGCQEGNAIEARNDSAGPAVQAVTIEDSTVSDYQKNGIVVTGLVNGTVTGNVVSGDGPIDYTAQNGIQVSYGATALVRSNTVTGNDYTPSSYVACGLLMYEADGVKQQANGLSANEVNLCNYGRGGGKVSASSE